MNVLQNYLKNNGVQVMTQRIDSADDKYHSHLFFEIFYIATKSIVHEVNGEKKLLSVGDVYFLRPGDNHTFHREFGNTCEHRDILLAGELVKKACEYLDDSFYNILTSSKQPFSFKLSQTEFNTLESEFSSFSELQTTAVGVNLSSRENFLAVLILNMLLQRLQNYHTANYPDWLQNLIAQLNDKDNFVKQPNEIVENINYNNCYISRAFTKHVGITLSQYFINAKLFYSLKLLRFTQMSISEVAISSGFATITYYNRVFKKQFGLSPSEYRNNQVRKNDTPPKNLTKND